MHHSRLFFGLATTLLVGIVFGGGSIPYLPSETLVRLASLPLLLAGLYLWFDSPSSNRSHWLIWFWLAPVALAGLELVPLPPGFWGPFANAEIPGKTFALLKTDNWFPTSVDPAATRLSMFALAPSMAVFFAVNAVGWRERRDLVLLLLAAGAIAVVLGFLQIAQGAESPLRFYAITNKSGPLGFFSNRNHFSAMLYCLTVLSLCWTAMLLNGAEKESSRGSWRSARLVTSISAVFLFSACQSVSGSRMGTALQGAALILGFVALVAGTAKRGTMRRFRLAFVAAGAALLVFFLVYGLSGLMERFDQASGDGGRLGFAMTTLRAAWAFLPLGAGLGAFGRVYGVFESPDLLLPGLYVNHAHNDFAELFLETGLFGLAWMGAFLFWWGRRTIALVKFDPTRRPPREISNLLLQRAGAIIVALLLLHSLVDYPLRTQALSMTFALACGLMTAPLPVARPWAKPANGSSRRADFEQIQRVRRSSRRHEVGVARVKEPS